MLAVFPCIGKSTIEESMVTGMGGMHVCMVHIHACMYEGPSARTILRKKSKNYMCIFLCTYPDP